MNNLIKRLEVGIVLRKVAPKEKSVAREMNPWSSNLVKRSIIVIKSKS